MIASSRGRGIIGMVATRPIGGVARRPIAGDQKAHKEGPPGPYADPSLPLTIR